MVPKHEAPYREFNVAAAVRDVSCVTCRACDVARDRSIGRESEEESRHSVGKEILPKFLLLFFSPTSGVTACFYTNGFRTIANHY